MRSPGWRSLFVNGQLHRPPTCAVEVRVLKIRDIVPATEEILSPGKSSRLICRRSILTLCSFSQTASRIDVDFLNGTGRPQGLPADDS